MPALTFDDLAAPPKGGKSGALTFDDLAPSRPAPRAEAPSGQMLPSYDPMGVPTGFTEAAPAATQMPYGEQMKKVGEFVGRTGRAGVEGAIAGVPGIFGDIESLGRMGLGYAGFDVDPESALPTTERIADWAFGEVETPEEKAGRVLGSIFSPQAPLRALAKAPRAIAESALIGRPGVRQAEIAAEAEAAGFKVAPSQARDVGPKSAVVTPAEQERLNRQATAAAGKEAPKADETFMAERAKEFDKQYRQVYNRNFLIDENVAKALDEIAKQERAIDPAGSSMVSGVASNLSARWKAAKQQADEIAAQQTMRRMMGGQKATSSAGQWIEKAFGPGERIDAPVITPQLARQMQVSEFRNLRPITSHDAPLWGADIKNVIDGLTEKLGLRVRPGVYVGSGGGAYGWASPAGHIFINEGLIAKREDALATALHEFGHQAEFQLFRYAPSEVKASINDAFRASQAQSAGKTVEQLRPVTAAKYDEAARQIVPTSAEAKRYYLGFNEWFAEQVSRWLTLTKEPQTLAEKFFAKIADMWKSIYAKVVGHVPMTKEIDAFMKSNWEGKLINEATTQRIFQAAEAGAEPAATTSSVAAKPVTAKIEGEQLRRLRSEMARRAATDADGNVRYQARQIVNQIDDVIEKSNPEVAARLKTLNEQYRAYMALQELRKLNAGDIIRAGHVSPKEVAQYLAREQSLDRHPLSQIGRYGSALQMRSLSEGAATTTDPLRSLLDRSQRVARYLTSPLSDPLQQAARAVQRRMTPGVVPPSSGAVPSAVSRAVRLQALGEENAP